MEYVNKGPISILQGFEQAAMRNGSILIIVITFISYPGCYTNRKDNTQMAEQREHAIELLRHAYDAFNRGDIAAAVARLDPQIEWTEPKSFPGGGTYHGQDGVAKYLTQPRAGWAEGRSEPERFVASGDRIVVFVHARVRLQGSSEWREARLADVYTFQNGRPIQMRAFADRQEALRWAGIKEPI